MADDINLKLLQEAGVHGSPAVSTMLDALALHRQKYRGPLDASPESRKATPDIPFYPG
jgi:hypothetical protein